jgi:hypothetical protein
VLLASIAQGLTIAQACQAAGMSRRAFFEWTASDPEFDRDYRDAYADGTDRYEQELHQRALSGLSDIALIFTLKCRDPERFNRKQVQLAIGGDASLPPVSVETQESVGVRLYLPHNNRDAPPRALEPLPPRTIDVEATAEPVTDETTSQAEEECQQSIRVKLRR